MPGDVAGLIIDRIVKVASDNEDVNISSVEQARSVLLRIIQSVVSSQSSAPASGGGA